MKKEKKTQTLFPGKFFPFAAIRVYLSKRKRLVIRRSSSGRFCGNCIELSAAAADKPAKNYLVSTAKVVAAAIRYLYGKGKKVISSAVWLMGRPES